jgi:hypothetical protein
MAKKTVNPAARIAKTAIAEARGRGESQRVISQYDNAGVAVSVLERLHASLKIAVFLPE